MPAMTAPLTPLMDDVQSDRPSGPWSPPCAPGDVIQGKYRIEKLVGSGGMAWVFEATHLQLQHPVALKILRVDPNGDNTEALARFRREARAAASISGDSTARVMDVGALDDASPFLVMELLEGRDLDAVIQARTRLSVASAVSYVLQACEGIAETHAAGIVHRDLKPSNLFLTETSDGSVRVKLLDFGVSKFADPSGDGARVTATRALVGSPVYMSPEQMRGSQNIDTRTDIWSIGIILYELLGHGHSPFEAPTLPAICARVLDKEPPPLRKIRRDLPRALEAVVLRCLEKEPERRFRTVADLADALVPFGPPDSRARAHRVRRILDGASSDRQSAVDGARGDPPRTPVVRAIHRVGGAWLDDVGGAPRGGGGRHDGGGSAVALRRAPDGVRRTGRAVGRASGSPRRAVARLARAARVARRSARAGCLRADRSGALGFCDRGGRRTVPGPGRGPGRRAREGRPRARSAPRLGGGKTVEDLRVGAHSGAGAGAPDRRPAARREAAGRSDSAAHRGADAVRRSPDPGLRRSPVSRSHVGSRPVTTVAE